MSRLAMLTSAAVRTQLFDFWTGLGITIIEVAQGFRAVGSSGLMALGYTRLGFLQSSALHQQVTLQLNAFAALASR